MKAMQLLEVQKADTMSCKGQAKKCRRGTTRGGARCEAVLSEEKVRAHKFRFVASRENLWTHLV